MKQLFLKASALMAATFLVVACGSNSPGAGPANPTGDVTKLNGAEYVLLEKGTLKSTEASLKGTGALVFKTPLTEQDNNYDLKFALEDGGSLTLTANADNALKGGVSVVLSRAGKKLKVQLASAAGDADDLSDDFASVAADKDISLAFDIHAHGHLIVDGVGGGELEYAFKVRPVGKAWGLALKNASVTQAKAGEEKHPH